MKKKALRTKLVEANQAEEARQFRRMLFWSMFVHGLILVAGIILYTLRSQAGTFSLPGEAQFVELYDTSEIPEMPAQEPEPPQQEPEIQEPPQEDNVDLAENVQPPTPTPRASSTPTPLPVFTPTPMPTAQPMATPTPKPVIIPTPKPLPTATPTPQEQAVAALDIPRRRPVMQPDAAQEDFATVLQTPQAQEIPERQSAIRTPVTGILVTGADSQSIPFSDRLSGEAPLAFETENPFPYPEYLGHIKEKIEGLWFPEGSGTVSIYLIIAQDGKILKSGVDKRTGVGVDKLRDSVIRTLELIKRFDPLPERYEGEMLQVRIMVRRK
jgi:outer membrane biosynthesis protein TonB